MVRIGVLLLMVTFGFASYSQDLVSFRMYDSQGKRASTKKLNDALKSSDLVFFGEEHNSVLSHWLTLSLLKKWNQYHIKGTVGFEMFEADQQIVLDSLSNHQIELEDLAKHTRLWSNWSDYAPILDWAINADLGILATNIPRKYASVVYKDGREALRKKSYFNPDFCCALDFLIDTTWSQYKKLEEMAVHMGSNDLLEAQAIKDATMAKFVIKELKLGHPCFHLNGSYHSDFMQGVPGYVLKSMPEAKVVTFTVVTAEKIGEFHEDWKGKADYIFVLKSDFPTSY
jgi:uncharacterized iron-regulated protein